MAFSEAYLLPKHSHSKVDTLDAASCTEALTELRHTLAKALLQLHQRDTHGLIVVLQGMDASGKDGIIRRNFRHVDPELFQVAAFKMPTPTELAHDFLWRIHPHCPPRGRTTIFNRSHYEDVLVPGAYGKEPESVLLGRMQSIIDFEAHLQRNHTHLLKFFLNISYEKQGLKIAERQTNPAKQHKFKPSDLTNREHWEPFMEQYQRIFKHCESRSPWYNIPCDIKWQKDYVFLRIIIEKLTLLNK